MTQTGPERELKNSGEGLKHILALLRVSRAYLQDKYGLPEVTLKSWENGTVKLTFTGAKRCVEIYRNEEIIVSEDWIMGGVGLDPTASVNVSKYFATPTNKNLPTEDDEVCIFRDANTFEEGSV